MKFSRNIVDKNIFKAKVKPSCCCLDACFFCYSEHSEDSRQAGSVHSGSDKVLDHPENVTWDVVLTQHCRTRVTITEYGSNWQSAGDEKTPGPGHPRHQDS